jgi:hypothetical protein
VLRSLRVIVDEGYIGRFEAEVRIRRRVESSNLRGSRSATVANSSSVVAESGVGRQSVGGSDKPGKESSRTLMTGAIMRREQQELFPAIGWEKGSKGQRRKC